MKNPFFVFKFSPSSHQLAFIKKNTAKFLPEQQIVPLLGYQLRSSEKKKLELL